MISLGRDFRESLERLNRHRVRYLIAGGFAMAVHGKPRYTKDIDLWVEQSPANGRLLEEVLRDFGFGELGVHSEDFLEPDVIIQLGREPNRIDLLTSLKGLEFQECYAARLVVQVSGLELPFIDRAHLIRHKRAVGRPRDLVDADELEA